MTITHSQKNAQALVDQLLIDLQNDDPDLIEDVDTGPTTNPPDVLHLTPSEQVEAIVDWSSENFEDPVHHTPWDSEEGGYVFIWGAFDARDEIYDAFGDAVSEAVIEEVIDRIGDGIEGAPHARRIGPQTSLDPVIAAKQNIFATLRGWADFAGEAADPDTDGISIRVADAVALLRSQRNSAKRG